MALLSLTGWALAGAQQVLATILEDAVRQAISSNPNVLNAAAGVRAAGHDLRRARARYYPSLDFDTRIGEEHTNIKQLSVSGTDNETLTRREATTRVRTTYNPDLIQR